MKTIDTLLSESCRTHKGKTALREKIVDGWVQTSYASLWEQAGQIAAGLQQNDFKFGEHAALLAPSSIRWVIAYLGILRAGGVVVPIDKELKTNELKHVLSDCEASLIFTTRGYLDSLLELKDDLPRLERIVLIEQRKGDFNRNREAVAAINDLVNEWYRLRKEFQLPEDRTSPLEQLAEHAYRMLMPPEHSLSAEPRKQDIFTPIHKIRQQLTQQARLLSFDTLCSDKEPDAHPRTTHDAAVILYTSGTTGRSKGAMLSHGNIVSNIQGATRLFKVDSQMHTLSFLPINHVFEQVCGVLLPLSVGGTVSFAESIKKLGENLAEVKPTFFLGVPAVYRIFYDRITKNVQSKAITRALFYLPFTRPIIATKIKKMLGENTTFISGGAALDPEIARGFRDLGIKILQGYGITETSPVISAEPPDAPRIGTVGPPLQDVEVRISNPDKEGSGEILVRGPNVMLGYFNNPDATAEVLVDGWYYTGDLGRIDQDGYLSICGRAKNLIVTPNGKNVYPEEVETELLKSPYIAEVMVYGHKVSPSAEEVHATIYPDLEAIDQYSRNLGKSSLTEDEIEKLIRMEVLEAGKRLADYKRVKKFTLREDEFPKTTTKKIKRFAVEAQIPTAE
ncbi:MAG: AMP-dependent synthetase [Desulfuromonadaceae bacterium GWC2_58_13]|nr:MAG: AMP-dependent synthetase [Desulfuromonadaceae bacterium GWC2_58_13]